MRCFIIFCLSVLLCGSSLIGFGIKYIRSVPDPSCRIEITCEIKESSFICCPRCYGKSCRPSNIDQCDDMKKSEICPGGTTQKCFNGKLILPVKEINHGYPCDTGAGVFMIIAGLCLLFFISFTTISYPSEQIEELDKTENVIETRIEGVFL